MLTVEPLTAYDVDTWKQMRAYLGEEWAESTDAAAREYLSTGTIDGLRHVILLARESQQPLGFAEVSLRGYAEGCSTSPVGYLEGWLVMDHARGRGVGRALVEAAEQWARAQGCTEFASDAELENAGSLAAHRKLGFEPVCDIRCFRKGL